MKCQFDDCQNERVERPAVQGIQLCAAHESELDRLMTADPLDVDAIIEWHINSRGGEEMYEVFVTEEMKLNLIHAQMGTGVPDDQRRLAARMLRRLVEIEGHTGRKYADEAPR